MCKLVKTMLRSQENPQVKENMSLNKAECLQSDVELRLNVGFHNTVGCNGGADREFKCYSKVSNILELGAICLRVSTGAKFPPLFAAPGGKTRRAFLI
jgi:hypothetical protein